VAVPAHDGVSVCLLGCAHPFAWVTKRLTVCTLCLCSGTQPHYFVLSVRAARIIRRASSTLSLPHEV
jgi:hypothetical protein